MERRRLARGVVGAAGLVDVALLGALLYEYGLLLAETSGGTDHDDAAGALDGLALQLACMFSPLLPLLAWCAGHSLLAALGWSRQVLWAMSARLMDAVIVSTLAAMVATAGEWALLSALLARLALSVAALLALGWLTFAPPPPSPETPA
jgi:hypothetical protein